MSKYLLIRVATENDFLFDWPAVAVVDLTEQFVAAIQAIRELVLKHDAMFSAEYNISDQWPSYLLETEVPTAAPWERLATEGYLIIDTEQTFATSAELTIEYEFLSVSNLSFCFKGSVTDQAFATWEVPFDFIEPPVEEMYQE